MTVSETIASGARELGVEINPVMAQRFETFSTLLIKWADSINLTSVTEPRRIAVSHFIDSLTVLRHIAPGSSVLDIGAGAGLPGIPLKICLPSIDLVLADSREKKVFFMKEAIRKLGLENARAVKARAGAEDEKIGGGFDVAVSRAVAKTAEVVRLSAPLVKKGGIVLVMKGKNGAREWREEQKSLSGAFNETAEELKLPVSGESRFILRLEKK